MGVLGRRAAPRHRALVAAVSLITSTAFRPVPPRLRPPTRRGAHPLDGHVPLEDAYPGLRFAHRSPDVAVIDGFLSGAECDALVKCSEGRLARAPVVGKVCAAPAHRYALLFASGGCQGTEKP